jgi:hypothetical protein
MATPATKPTTAVKEKKPQVAASKRISDQLKRLAVGGKLTKDELTKIGELANSLVVFVS